MESSKGDVDGSDKSVKKTPPSGGKKRSTEKRKISDDSSLTSVNIKVWFLATEGAYNVVLCMISTCK